MGAPAFEFSAKAPDAFRTISEVAADLDLPQHVLRFWESKFSQIKPVKRAGGRRFYRPDDIDLLRGIRALLYRDGLTIKGVQKILKDRGVRHVTGIGRGARFTVAAPLPPMPMPVKPAQPVLTVRPQSQEVDMFRHVEGLKEDERVKLELLLSDLLRLKARLRTVQQGGRKPIR